MNEIVKFGADIVPFPLPRRDAVRVEIHDAEGLMGLIRSIGHAGLRRYCIDQFREARNIEDVAAAVRLVHMVTGTRP